MLEVSPAEDVSLHWSWHNDVIKWKRFLRYWPFVQGIHRWPVNSLHKGQWRGALMFSLICTWIYGWVNNGEAGDLRHHHAHCDGIVMGCREKQPLSWQIDFGKHANIFTFIITSQLWGGSGSWNHSSWKVRVVYPTQSLLQLHLHSQCNTWLQWIGQRQLQEEMRNIEVLGFGVAYVRGLMVKSSSINMANLMLKPFGKACFQVRWLTHPQQLSIHKCVTSSYWVSHNNENQ